MQMLGLSYFWARKITSRLLFSLFRCWVRPTYNRHAAIWLYSTLSLFILLRSPLLLDGKEGLSLCATAEENDMLVTQSLISVATVDRCKSNDTLDKCLQTAAMTQYLGKQELICRLFGKGTFSDRLVFGSTPAGALARR